MKETLLSALSTPLDPSQSEVHIDISIVIPSYNEEAHLAKTLTRCLLDCTASSTASTASTASTSYTAYTAYTACTASTASTASTGCCNGPRVEVIVSDGGSKDGTKAICEEFIENGVTFVTGGSSRAECQNIGASHARGSVILFLHADTLLPRGYANHVMRHMQDPFNIIGAFWFDVDNQQLPGVGLLRWLVDFRSHWGSLPYGDQALFFRKEVFNALGGFPLVPLMEDYDLVQRVRQLGVGRVSLLPVDDEGKGHLKNDGSTKQCGGQNASSSDVRKSLRVITSARRWEEHGVIWTTVMNQIVIFGRKIGVPHDLLAKWYYGLSMKRKY